MSESHEPEGNSENDPTVASVASDVETVWKVSPKKGAQDLRKLAERIQLRGFLEELFVGDGLKLTKHEVFLEVLHQLHPATLPERSHSTLPKNLDLAEKAWAVSVLLRASEEFEMSVKGRYNNIQNLTVRDQIIADEFGFISEWRHKPGNIDDFCRAYVRYVKKQLGDDNTRRRIADQVRKKYPQESSVNSAEGRPPGKPETSDHNKSKEP